MKLPGFVLVGMLAAGLGGTLLAGQGGSAPAEKQSKGLRKAPITYSDPSSGPKMYKDYCAACHGPEGKGDGPAVEFLKTPPPDLQTLAQRNSGKYPKYKVTTILQLGPGTRAHGTSDMPVWGPAFRSQDTNAKVTELRIRNLTAFVETLQKK